MRHAKLIAALAFAAIACAAQAQTAPGNGQGNGQAGSSGNGPAGAPVNTIKEIFEKLRYCWKPPVAEGINPMDITVIVSFNRSGCDPGPPQDHL